MTCDRKVDINSLYICSPHLYTVATLRWEIQKSHFNSIIYIYFRLFTSSQKKTNCYSFTHHTWKMSPHYLAKCTTFSSLLFFTHIKYHSQYGRVAEACCCDMGWISAERGGRCSWSVAKKTGSTYPHRRWSFGTFAVTLLAWHLPHITASSANPQLAFFRATNVWRNAT